MTTTALLRGRDMKHTYSVRTWDTDEQRYTPATWIISEWEGLTIWQLKSAICELRKAGYSAHRIRDADGTHDDNDWELLVERDDKQTDGIR